MKLFDPLAEYAEIGLEVDDAIARVIRSGRFVGGPEVEAFEEEFSEFLGGRPVAAVGNGTDALRLALMAVGVGPGDEVVVPANTFAATAMAAESLGASVAVADVDPDLYVVSPQTIEPLINEHTRALIPVHLYGQPAPMPEILALASSRALTVVEDAAQAHGATLDGRPVGTLGAAAGFSFYPSKNLGAYGDGGAVAGEPALIERVRRLRDLGRGTDGEHEDLGINSRLDTIQAAVLRVKLTHLERWVAARRRLADRYRELLADLPVALPSGSSGAAHAFHLFVVRVAERDRVRSALWEAGVETGIHYPRPIHLQSAHRGRVRVPVGGAPVAERLAGEILSLPLYPQMTDQQVELVAAALREAIAVAPSR